MYSTQFAEHVRQGRFRRRLLGFHPDDVKSHLDTVSGWFTLAGMDDLFEQRLVEADRAAARIVEDARAQAATILRDAQAESRAIREGARQHAALERRGRSRVGRPVGAS